MADQMDDKVDKSRRGFFRKAAKAAGGAAAAGIVATGAGKAVSAASRGAVDISLGYEADDRRQTRLFKQKKMVLMSEDEKQRMLDEIIGHHHDVTKKEA